MGYVPDKLGVSDDVSESGDAEIGGGKEGCVAVAAVCQEAWHVDLPGASARAHGLHVCHKVGRHRGDSGARHTEKEVRRTL
jgi:hypothetical protein